MGDHEEPTSVIDSLDVIGVTKLAPEVYKDLAKPSATQLGQSLVVVARAVDVALAPVRGLVWSFEQIEEWVKSRVTEKLAAKNATDIQPPPPNLAGPVFLNLSFVRDIPDLREMYANLLASAMDQSTSGTAHPAFAQIIEQLSPDEARVLRRIGCEKRWHIGETEYGTFPYSKTNGPSLFEQWDKLCDECGVAHSESRWSYLDNLLRLRLFEESITTKSELPAPHPRFLEELELRDFTSRSIYLSMFGEHFVNACIRNSDSSVSPA